MSYIIFDIGGTNTRVAATEDCRTFSDPVKFKTPKTFKAGMQEFKQAVDSLGVKNIKAMAGGVRGVMSEGHESIVGDAILTGWVDEPLLQSLKDMFKTEVYIENDTATVGLGEYHFGAGEDVDIMVYHTVSTGVGGVKIEEGVIDSYDVGFEPGKQILDIDRTILGEDVLPTLENLVSGTALEQRTGHKPYDIPQSDAVWDQLAEYLAHGLRNTILYWSPDMIVLGGSMIVGDPRILLDDIQRHTQEIVGDEITCPLIKDAELGDVGGLYGAMALLEQHV